MKNLLTVLWWPSFYCPYVQQQLAQNQFCGSCGPSQTGDPPQCFNWYSHTVHRTSNRSHGKKTQPTYSQADETMLSPTKVMPYERDAATLKLDNTGNICNSPVQTRTSTGADNSETSTQHSKSRAKPESADKMPFPNTVQFLPR